MLLPPLSPLSWIISDCNVLCSSLSRCESFEVRVVVNEGRPVAVKAPCQVPLRCCAVLSSLARARTRLLVGPRALPRPRNMIKTACYTTMWSFPAPAKLPATPPTQLMRARAHSRSNCMMAAKRKAESPYFCEACGKGFDYKSKFSRHLESGSHKMYVESLAIMPESEGQLPTSEPQPLLGDSEDTLLATLWYSDIMVTANSYIIL